MNTNSSSESNRKKNKDESQTFQFGPWSIRSWKSHILESEGVQREKFQQDLNLPQIPEMVFAENILRIHHESGCGIEFNALDALRLVDAFNDPIKVAASEEWQTARSNCQHIKNVVAPFDWTFTTDYKGTIFEEQPGILRGNCIHSYTGSQVNMHDSWDAVIFFFESSLSLTILTFKMEVPLSDNSSSKNLNVAGTTRKTLLGLIARYCETVYNIVGKAQILMSVSAIAIVYFLEFHKVDTLTPGQNISSSKLPVGFYISCASLLQGISLGLNVCFFILLRLFVRVDQVLIRMNETRFYHEGGTNFILREFTSREESTKNIPVSNFILYCSSRQCFFLNLKRP
uniref:TIP41-like protein n=1 Tax=Biomphalaria glabrata TaxID=6526 RepID=A0A2C9LMD1_BIOGL